MSCTGHISRGSSPRDEPSGCSHGGTARGKRAGEPGGSTLISLPGRTDCSQTTVHTSLEKNCTNFSQTAPVLIQNRKTEPKVFRITAKPLRSRMSLLWVFSLILSLPCSQSACPVLPLSSPNMEERCVWG